MRSPAPPLAPILRSAQQAEMLAVLLLHPESEFSLTDLARRLDAPVSTLHGEVGRLVEAGILTVKQVGRSKLLRANPQNRLVPPLTELIMVSYGPHVVVSEEFEALPNVDQILVYGSWAARYHGQPGPAPHDVDVLVVGTPDRADVYDAADRAEQRLNMPVNPTICSRRRWADSADALIQQIKASPVVVAVDHMSASKVAHALG